MFLKIFYGDAGQCPGAFNGFSRLQNPMENPYCSCTRTRVRSVLATLLLVVVYVTTSVVAYATVGGGVAGFLPR